MFNRDGHMSIAAGSMDLNPRGPDMAGLQTLLQCSYH